MTDAAKQSSIDAAIARLESPTAIAAFGAPEVARLRVQLQPLADAFRAAKLPASAELGRADADAFAYRDYKVDEAKTNQARVTDRNASVVMTYGVLSVEDLGAIRATLDSATGTGAADLAQYLESLRRDPRVAAVREKLEEKLTDTYKKAAPAQIRADLTVATRWYSVDVEIARLLRGEPGAADRVRSLIGGVHP
jgi:hypothetical protein